MAMGLFGGFTPSQPKQQQQQQTSPSMQGNFGATDTSFNPANQSNNSGVNGGSIAAGAQAADTSGGAPSGGGGGPAPSTAIQSVIQGGAYTPTVGWDTNKLMDPNKHDPKYDWLRAVQSVGGNQNLGQAVNYYNQNYGQANGMASYGGSGDKVNFGGGVGDVDVLFDQEGARKDLWAPTSPNSTFNGPNGQMPAAAPGQQNIQQMIQMLMKQMSMPQAQNTGVSNSPVMPGNNYGNTGYTPNSDVSQLIDQSPQMGTKDFSQSQPGYLQNGQYMPGVNPNPSMNINPPSMGGYQPSSIMQGQMGGDGGYGQPNNNGGFLQNWLQQMQQMQPAPSGPQVPYTTRNGQEVPANPGDMISNGWGGYKPYDPNFTGVN